MGFRKYLSENNIDENKIDDLKAVGALNKEIQKLLNKAAEHRSLSEERMFWAQIDRLKQAREKLYKTNF